jgi:hypothetical protein
MDLVERLNALAERARARTEERRRAAPARVVRLPVWPEDARTCPSCVLRSALFGVVRRGRRRALEREILATWAGVVIRYTGWRLDQADLDVWLSALHLAREHPLGEPVSVRINAVLRAMGRPTDGRSHEWFKGAVARLTACAVEITAGDKTFGGPLVEGFQRDEATGDHLLHLSPWLAELFEDDALTWLDWEIRRSLEGDLAKWLHGYIASHRATARSPHRLGLERLRDLCGSETEGLRFFRRDVREAMQALQAAGVVAAWCITPGDALEVVRPNRPRRLIDGPRPPRDGR